jgi:3-carboxy-cis,cis-muconate cycloisomerase
MSDAPLHNGLARSMGLFDGVLARGSVRSMMDDDHWLRAMLEVEAALARAQAQAGVLPPEAGSAVGDLCATVRLDVAELSEAAAASGNPVVPLVQRLRAAASGSLVTWIHKGATSQDILDSATMLVARRALDPLLDDVSGAADAAARLAARHRDTAMAGRTLLQLAMPTTLGLKAAGWMVGLDAAAERLSAVRSALPVQFGGAAGTRAGLGGAGTEVTRLLAAELGLAEPVLPWHTIRTPIADLAAALGTSAGATAKPARDVILLAQDEVAEVREGRPGGSSALAHKHNPVAAISALAAAAQCPGLVSTLLTNMVQEHERAAGAWHAEWRPLRELLVSTGSAASWLRECLTHLEVDPVSLARNLMKLALLRGEDPNSTPDVGDAPSLVDQALSRRTLRSEP